MHWGKLAVLLCYVLSLIYPVSDLGKPSKEQLSLQLELQRLQSARRLDAEEFDNQKQVLQAQLQSEVSYITAPCCGKQFFLHLEEFVFAVCPQISGYQKIYMSFTFVSIFFCRWSNVPSSKLS